MSSWGGPQRRLKWLLALVIIQGCAYVAAGLRPSLVLITASLFVISLCFAFISTLFGPIFQTKIAPAVQGRVFATVVFLAVILEPFGHLTVGPVAERIFEPAMAEGGALARFLGPAIGVGEGRGMAVIFLLMGAAIAALGVYGFLNPAVRRVEEELPDAISGDEPADATEQALEPA